MQKLGQIIKQRRIELGYTLKAISDKTRVPVIKLEAIENGDLKFFENDLSYVKFYVRYYCNALHLNYDDFKEELELSLDQFSDTTKLLKQVEYDEIHSRVIERVQHKKESSLNKKKKLDLSFISFLSVISLLVLSLVLVIFFIILPNLNANPEPIISDSNRDLPGEIVEPITPDEDPVIVENPNIVITKVDTTSYEISNFSENQEIQFMIEFKYNAYVSVQIDGEYSMNPQSQLFQAGTILDMKLDAMDKKIVEFYIGYMDGSLIKLDGEYIELDESIANKQGKVTFTFTFMGDN